MTEVQLISNAWDSQREFTKPRVLFARYGDNTLLTISDNGPIYYFADKFTKSGTVRPVFLAAVRSKCYLIEGDIPVYDIRDTPSNLDSNTIALKRISCEGGETPLEKFVEEKILPFK